MRRRRRPKPKPGVYEKRGMPLDLAARVSDVVPEDATNEQLLGMYGEDGYEIVAFREFMRRMRLAQANVDVDEEGRLRVGENFYRYAAGELSGRELVEAEGLLAGGAPSEEVTMEGEEQEQRGSEDEPIEVPDALIEEVLATDPIMEELATGPTASPCHGSVPVEHVHGSVWMCLAGLSQGEPCGALFDVAGDGTMSVLKVTSSEQVRDAERAQQIEFGRGTQIAEVARVAEHEGRFSLDCKEVVYDSEDGHEKLGGLDFGFGGIRAADYCAAAGRIPQVGDRIRVFMEGMSSVIGVDYLVPKDEGAPADEPDTWAVVYFHTAAERHQRWAAGCEESRQRREVEFAEKLDELDARYDGLPTPFKLRVDGYRERGGREWRVDYESYETFCLSEAAKIAEHVRASFEVLRSGERNLPEAAKANWPDATEEQLAEVLEREPTQVAAQVAVGEFRDLAYEEREGVISSDHSGNTFGAACSFAWMLLAYEAGDDIGAAIIGHYGALAPLVGSEAYSDAAAAS